MPECVDATSNRAGERWFLPPDGEMASAIRRHDWSQSLGDPAAWPQPLKTLAGVMLASKQPMFLAWGAERTWLYNDAFVPILGRKHPWALGRPALDEVWAEARAALEPLFDRVFSGEAVHMEDFALDLDRRGRLEEAHFSFSYTPVRDEGGVVRGLFGACIETTEQVIGERRLASARERQSRQFEQAPGFIIITRGPDHVVEFVNRAHVHLFGSGDWQGKAIRDAFPAIAEQGFFELLDQVYATGVPYAAHAAPVRYRRAHGEAEATRYLDFIYAPIIEEDGSVTGIFCEGFDGSEARRLEDQRRLLTRELEHRMKNVMAMVAAIINQSFRGSTSLVDIRRTIAHRMSALSHAHEILIRSDWESAPIASVVDGALAPHRVNDARFLVRGPDLLLAPKPALSLSLAVNELATNAIKYGALSAAGGQVEISWHVGGREPEFHFDWRESGGPAPTAPSRPGFGLRLIERSLSEDFRGEVGIDFLPQGIHCHVRTRLAGLQPEKDAAQDDPSPKA
jgi:two-component sensor histidine kinase